jgi:transcriptional regulator with XRE-family HTH domain
MRKSIHSKAEATLRALLRGAREKAGLTQHELAKRLKKPQSFVAKYETGERRLDVIEFVVITRAMDADPAKLMRNLLAEGF